MTFPLARSLRFRITLLFGVVALLVGVPLALLVSQLHRADLLTDRQSALKALARASVGLLEAEIDARVAEVDGIARLLGSLALADDDTRIAATVDFDREDTPFVWMGYADSKGRVLRGSGGVLEGRNVSERPWFRAGRDTPMVGNPHAAFMLAPFLPARADGLAWRLLDFAAPVRNARGELQGVLGAHLDISHMRTAVARLEPLFLRRPQRQVMLLEGSEVVAFLHGSPVTGGVAIGSTKPADWREGGQWLVATAGFGSGEGAPPLDLGVVVREPAARVESEVRALSRPVTAAALLAAVLFTALAWVAAGRITHPVTELVALARELGQAGRPLAPGGIQLSSSELQELADALFQLSERVAAGQAALKASDTSREEGERERDRLATLLLTDPLTGIANRRAAEYRLEAVFHQVRTRQLEASLLLIDIDHFKQVNDTFGHAAGDAALVRVAQALAQTVRGSDLPARFGGEEFVCLLPGTRLRDALGVAEKVRSAIAAAEVPEVGRLTASVGVARLEAEDAGPEAALERADAALYAAKRAGRNRVVGPDGPQG